MSLKVEQIAEGPDHDQENEGVQCREDKFKTVDELEKHFVHSIKKRHPGGLALSCLKRGN